jgi:hypothetical protein
VDCLILGCGICMKKLIASLLLVAFAAQSFSHVIIVANFYINRSYIAAKLCENRYRPMLKCNGKCILAQKIKQQEKKERQDPQCKLENKNEVFTSHCSFLMDIPGTTHKVLSYSLSRTGKPVDSSFKFFHPPKLA